MFYFPASFRTSSAITSAEFGLPSFFMFSESCASCSLSVTVSTASCNNDSGASASLTSRAALRFTSAIAFFVWWSSATLGDGTSITGLPIRQNSLIELQDRGKFFIDPGEDVYGGQVVGEHVHDNDLVINVTKAKQLTNVRASGSDEKARVIPKVVMSLEECLEYIKGDELVEVTPKSIRMRKITLDHLARKRSNKD